LFPLARWGREVIEDLSGTQVSIFELRWQMILGFGGPLLFKGRRGEERRQYGAASERLLSL